jgi:hypothetical protein
MSEDVHLRAMQQVSGEEVQREDPLCLRSQELRPPRAVPAGRRVDPGVPSVATIASIATARLSPISTTRSSRRNPE